jgi:LDH2 family malate/lactate/ureidoglycolate dehydrogenase
MTRDEDVRLPGARRHAAREQSSARGIEVPDTLIAELEKLASG